MEKWKVIGHVAVNSGQIRIADTCDSEGGFKVDTTWGDGLYPIVEQYDDDGNVVSILIDFDIYGLGRYNEEE